MSVSGSADLTKVTFYMDGQSIGEDTTAPFDLTGATDSYPLGIHTFYAEGTTAGGQTLTSNKVTFEFVTAQQGWETTGKIALPILIVAGLALLVSALLPVLTGRKRKPLAPGTPRNYGAAGGAICRNCGYPFSRSVLAPNLVMGKLERCPNCGKWQIARAASPKALREAEQRELEAAQESGQVPTMSEEEKLRKELEQSRYQDM